MAAGLFHDQTQRKLFDLLRDLGTGCHRDSLSREAAINAVASRSAWVACAVKSVAGQGFIQSQETDRYQISSYLAPQEFDRAMGTLATTSCEAKSEETVRVPAGEFRARHVIRKTDKEISEWWLHPKLGVPVRGMAGGIEYVLTSIEPTSSK